MTTHKSKAGAFILSFFVPGLGHLYLGLNRRGLQLMIAFFMCVALSSLLHFIFPFLIAVIWFYALFDALQQTARINAWHAGLEDGERGERHLHDKSPLDDPIVPVPDSWPMDPIWIGVALILLGILLLLRIVVPGIWFWLSQIHIGSILLALVMIGFGAWLIRRQSSRK